MDFHQIDRKITVVASIAAAKKQRQKFNNSSMNRVDAAFDLRDPLGVLADVSGFSPSALDNHQASTCIL